MKRILFFVGVVVCSFSVSAQTRVNPRRNVKAAQNAFAAQNPSVQMLPIRRVILYSNGVAYIERRGTVSGHAEVNLSFKQSQVDDVLKSMLVLDLGAGKVGAISYNSSAPPAARMAEIPFSVEANSQDDDDLKTAGGLAGVLAQLQGAQIAVVSTTGGATGAIVTVQKKQIIKTAGKKGEEEKTALMPEFSLVLASDAGEIKSFDLANVRSVKLLDEGAKRDLSEFTKIAASARRRDAKTITITSDEVGQREMIVSYTIAAPIWKTTYRVVLGEDGKPFFQGWAIVDNVSDEDWRSVKLSLVSGSPVSFIQPLQQPLYRRRPIIEIPDDLSLQPQIYDPTTGTEIGNGFGNGNGDGTGSGFGSGSGNGMGSAPPAPRPKVVTEISDALTAEESGVATAATGAKLGDLFQYDVTEAVTVLNNRSALIPIVQTKMDGERVSIFREPDDENAANKDRPMSGLLLKNTTPLTFENGALTVLERNAYAGEALMERLKASESRLISFAVDLETLVTVKHEEEREPAKLVKAVAGSFQIHYFKTDKKIYTLQNQSDRTRTIYVEHPTREKWILSDDTPRPAEVTENDYRFRIELKPFERVVLPVIERQGLMDSYVLGDLTQSDIDLFINQRFVTDVTRQKLENLISLRAQIKQTDDNLEKLAAEEKRISEDQGRFRENIAALTKTSEAKSLVARYISKTNDQETRLEQIARERAVLESNKEKFEKELAAAIRAFEV